MRIFLLNAFSLSMLDRETQRRDDAAVLTPRPIGDPVAYLALCEAAGAEIVSAVGHADTATVFANVLGRSVPVNRTSVKLTRGETAGLIGQYVGPRLPEGARELPAGARIEWWVV